MPAKVTSKIAWKNATQKRRAKRLAKKEAGSLSAHIQQLYETILSPAQ